MMRNKPHHSNQKIMSNKNERLSVLHHGEINVGDTVTIYNGELFIQPRQTPVIITITSAMCQHLGKTCEVVEFDSEDWTFKLSVDGGKYWWPGEYLTVVKRVS